MADVASSFKQWSQTVGSNLPTAATTIGAGLAPNLQQIQSTLRTELASRSTALTAAATTDLNTKDEGTVLVSNTSGTIAISSFGTVSAGIKKLLTFSITGGALSIVYNATSLILPSLTNLTVAHGDSLLIESLGSGNWKVHAYYKAVGMAGLDDVINAVPAGTRISFTGLSAPVGYLVCPSSQTNISRTTYAALFAAIGTTWGAGDGSTTFGMPWYPNDYASISNGSVGTQSVGQVIAHSHSINANSAGTGPGSGIFLDGTPIRSTGSTGGSANFAAGVRELFCVKY